MQKVKKLFLTPREAAELLGVSRTTFWRLVSTRRLPVKQYRLGARLVRFSLPEIESWARTGCPTVWTPKQQQATAIAGALDDEC